MPNDELRVRELLDEADLRRTVDAYFRALDERRFDAELFATFFLSDGAIVRPNGTTVVGPEAIAASHAASFARFESTQHLLTGHSSIVDAEDTGGADYARLRANLVATHLWPGANNDVNDPANFFLAGAVVTSELRRTSGGWRIASLQNVNVWRAGSGFANLAHTDKSG